eukprot:TRINITY_DN7952_c0_g1_i1.p1 TRINITY_DN7952_c0_g1~~TRINITY_DN7952_c0_g1_i1.p1  ORF type:complete len:278 (+),score=29.07 TRINITY_DN7952_c0_g1_i1:189-1022(+)
MRPNEHKQKRSAAYKKTHNIPSKTKGHGPGDNSARPSNPALASASARADKAPNGSFGKRSLRQLSRELPEIENDTTGPPTYEQVLKSMSGRKVAASFDGRISEPTYTEFDLNPTRAFPVLDVRRLGDILQSEPLSRLVGMELFEEDTKALNDACADHCALLEARGVRFQFESNAVDGGSPTDSCPAQPVADPLARNEAHTQLSPGADADNLDFLDTLMMSPPAKSESSRPFEAQVDDLLGAEENVSLTETDVPPRSPLLSADANTEDDDLDFLDSMM